MDGPSPAIRRETLGPSQPHTLQHEMALRSGACTPDFTLPISEHPSGHANDRRRHLPIDGSASIPQRPQPVPLHALIMPSARSASVFPSLGRLGAAGAADSQDPLSSMANSAAGMIGGIFHQLSRGLNADSPPLTPTLYEYEVLEELAGNGGRENVQESAGSKAPGRSSCSPSGGFSRLTEPTAPPTAFLPTSLAPVGVTSNGIQSSSFSSSSSASASSSVSSSAVSSLLNWAARPFTPPPSTPSLSSPNSRGASPSAGTSGHKSKRQHSSSSEEWMLEEGGVAAPAVGAKLEVDPLEKSSFQAAVQGLKRAFSPPPRFAQDVLPTAHRGSAASSSRSSGSISPPLPAAVTCPTEIRSESRISDGGRSSGPPASDLLNRGGSSLDAAVSSTACSEAGTAFTSRPGIAQLSSRVSGDSTLRMNQVKLWVSSLVSTLLPHLPTLLVLAGIFIVSTAVVGYGIWTLPLRMPGHGVGSGAGGKGSHGTSLRDLSLAELFELAKDLRAYERSSGFASLHTLAVLSLLFTWKQSFTIPGSLLMNLVFGALYGTWQATLFTSILTALGGVFCYLMCRPLGGLVGRLPGLKKALRALAEGLEERMRKDELRKEKRRRLLRRRQRLAGAEGERLGSPTRRVSARLAARREVARRALGSSTVWSYLFLLRIVPIIPYGVLNIACGVLKIPLLPYFGTLLVGSVPWNIVTCQAGDILQDLVGAIGASHTELAAELGATQGVGGDSSSEKGISAIAKRIWTTEMMVKFALLSLMSAAPLLINWYIDWNNARLDAAAEFELGGGGGVETDWEDTDEGHGLLMGMADGTRDARSQQQQVVLPATILEESQEEVESFGRERERDRRGRASVHADEDAMLDLDGAVATATTRSAVPSFSAASGRGRKAWGWGWDITSPIMPSSTAEAALWTHAEVAPGRERKRSSRFTARIFSSPSRVSRGTSGRGVYSKTAISQDEEEDGEEDDDDVEDTLALLGGPRRAPAPRFAKGSVPSASGTFFSTSAYADGLRTPSALA